uniref:NADH dehydrogenase subunit 6 n=1 Tax=Thelaira chrysopruinosa TaxID=3061172 RepID=UPI00286D5399|nr:NADH dehydrogenase subunit 6 [Thelaira chrysopruinosa]WKF19269.1 NADH dehydrogenase subunit 6 [Thelaira chrysopruinosa]
MLQWMLYMFMIITNLIFLSMKHPLAMGLTLLIQTLLVCLLTGMISKSFWFSYILFLMFVGGMLVLFIYMTSLASNEMFSFSTKLMFILLLIFMISLFFMIYMNKHMYPQMKNNEMKSINKLNSFMIENSLTLMKLYNYPMNLLTIMLINYLLITLIAVVKITKMLNGPLRPMFN